MPDADVRCGICRRTLFMRGMSDGGMCSDCGIEMPGSCSVPEVMAAIWGARRAWQFATEHEPDNVLVAARPGDPGPSRSRIRRRR